MARSFVCLASFPLLRRSQESQEEVTDRPPTEYDDFFRRSELRIAAPMANIGPKFQLPNVLVGTALNLSSSIGVSLRVSRSRAI